MDAIRLVLRKLNSEHLTQNFYDVSKLRILGKSFTVWLVLIILFCYIHGNVMSDHNSHLMTSQKYSESSNIDL